MKKWLKGVVFATVLAALMVPCKEVFADDGWGSYGDNVKWHFYEATGTLQFEGEGAMDDDPWHAREKPWYSYHEDVKKVVIGKGITHVAGQAFYKYSNLTSVSFSDTVVSIGDHAFYSSGLKKLVLPENLVSLGEGSFEKCNNLKSVRLPGTLKEVAFSAFDGCSQLSNIKIDEGVEVLDTACFAGTAITTIDIPSSVKTISSAFRNCDKLDHITIPKTVTELGDICHYCHNLRYAVVEAQCGIPEDAFAGCDNLAAVRLGEGVTSIGYFSFWNDKKLTAMYVPASVTEIDESAFCEGTENITFYGYTDTAAYNYAGMNQFVKFVDVAAQGMGTWDQAWNQAIKKGTSSDSAKKTMKFVSVSAKKGATKITGKLSVSGATVKIQVGNAKYKKAVVNKKVFSLKTSKLKKGTTIRIRVTKNGYKTLSRLIKIK